MQPIGGRAYFRCDYCHSFQFPEAAEDGVTPLQDVTDLPCPVCADPLVVATVEGFQVSCCNRCRGVLATNPVFSQALAHRRTRWDVPAPPPQPISATERGRRVRCPSCKSKMDCHPYGGGAPVVIDTCARCRLIWLDAGELDGIARHRPAGRRAAADAGLLVSTASRSQPPTSPWSWGDREYTDNDPGTGASLWDVLARLFT